jgi:hypothetical protein
VTESRRLLQHFLAALAYRTQKALRDAPDGFGEFGAGSYVRTPHELLRHMSSVIGFARTKLHGGTLVALPLPTFAEEITRFHEMLAALHADFADESLDARISDAQFLQGPLADAMTHAGQLALLRRLAGSPVPSEDFIEAAIDTSNVSERQPPPAAPDDWWRPDQPSMPETGAPRRMTGTNRIQ